MKDNRKELLWNGTKWLCVVVSLFMGLWVCQSNSPLYQTIGWDNGIFLSMGKAIAQGYVPYVDYIENKGPLFFLLMAIPQMIIKGNFGVFLLQVAMLAGATLCIFSMVTSIMGKEKRHALVAVIPWATYLFMGNFGNFCEEYDLFLTMLALLFYLRLTLRSQDERLAPFMTGLCAMSIFLIKASDILGVGVIALAILIRSVKLKKGFWKAIAWMAFGAAIIAIPVSIYLFSVGAFMPMVQEYLLNNFVYVSRGSSNSVGGFFETRLQLVFLSDFGARTYIPMAVMLVALVLLFFSRKKKIEAHMPSIGFLVWFGLANFVTAYVANTPFRHHTLLCSATLALSLLVIVVYVYERTSVQTRVANILLAVGIVVVFGINIIQIKPSEWVNSRQYQKQLAYYCEFMDEVRECPDSVYTIDIPTDWYWFNDVLPAYPYFSLMGFIWDNVGENMAERFEAYLVENPIQLILVKGELEWYRNSLTDGTIAFISENYDLVHTDSTLMRHLYRYRGDN